MCEPAIGAALQTENSLYVTSVPHAVTMVRTLLLYIYMYTIVIVMIKLICEFFGKRSYNILTLHFQDKQQPLHEYNRFPSKYLPPSVIVKSYRPINQINRVGKMTKKSIQAVRSRYHINCINVTVTNHIISGDLKDFRMFIN